MSIRIDSGGPLKLDTAYHMMPHVALEVRSTTVQDDTSNDTMMEHYIEYNITIMLNVILKSLTITCYIIGYPIWIVLI